MSDNIKTHRLKILAMSFASFGFDIFLFFQNEGVQTPSVFNVVPPPVIVKLKRAVALVAVVDICEIRFFIAITTDTEGREQISIGIDLKRNPQYANFQRVQGSGWSHVIG